MYETLSETDFVSPRPESAFLPNSFSDISSFLEKKLEIMRHYKNEMKDHPFPRSEQNIRYRFDYYNKFFLEASKT